VPIASSQSNLSPIIFGVAITIGCYHTPPHRNPHKLHGPKLLVDFFIVDSL
jgi:hypothetical protein